MQIERDEFWKYEDIDLIALFKIIWVGKWKVIFLTGIAAIFSVLYALSLPNIYKSEVLLTTVGATSSGSSGLSSLGGLASFTGVSLGTDEVDDVTLGLVTLKSRLFIKDFIVRRDILVPLMALESWEDGNLTINDEVYDIEKRVWRDEKPGLQEAYNVFLGKMSASKTSTTGIIKVSFSSKSPVLAHQWVTWLIEDLNNSMRNREIKEANRAIVFLEEKLKSSVSVDMRAMLLRLMQKQTENIMLANVKADYLFRVIDPAIIPETKTSPSRSLICIVGTLFGGFLSVLLVFLLHFWGQKTNKQDLEIA